MSQAVEVVKSNIAWIKRNEKDLENWLETFLSKKGLWLTNPESNKNCECLEKSDNFEWNFA